MTSIFYEHPLTDRILGLPIDVYIGSGLALHWSSEVQDSTFELVAKIHFYYTFTWPVRWRIGVAEGFSWIEEVTYIERENMESKDYRPSQLMNYLDFTLDVNLGDIFRSSALENAWLGFSIHHRSSIFESASQFGRIKGGSNYPSIYIQWDLL
jgi:outer membrane protein